MHTVTLPESGTGNVAPQSAGASLVVVYRDPSEPLRKILFYDGIAVLPDLAGAKMSQTIRGIYQSGPASPPGSRTSSARARATRPNGCSSKAPAPRRGFEPMRSLENESVGPIVDQPDVRLRQAIEQPAAATFSSLMPGATIAADGFGEFVTTTVDHQSGSPYDCLAFAATIFSTTVMDQEGVGIGDGIPDGIEGGVPGLVRDADGTNLPNLRRSVPVTFSETSSSRWTR